MASKHPMISFCLISIFSMISYWFILLIFSHPMKISFGAFIFWFSVANIKMMLITSIYRLTFHPLANHPGPWLAAITDLYTVIFCLRGDRHINFYLLHQKYGLVVRYGPNRISINTNSALKSIYGVNANTQKSQVYATFSHFFKVSATMTTLDKKKHAFKRRVTVQALTPNAVKGLEELMLKNIRVFLKGLVADNEANCRKGEEKHRWSPPRDMTKLVSWLMSDIMGDVTFSRNWNMQRSDENRGIIDLLSMGTCLINMAGHIPLLLALKLDQIFFPKLVAGTYKFKSLSKSQSEWRAGQRSLPIKDIFAALLNAKDPETGLGYTMEDLIAEAGIFIVAGSDTTATSLTATLFYLLHSLSVLEKVEAEVHQRFHNIDEICIGAQLHSCQLLLACIDEAMRLSPSVGAILPREVLEGGIVVDGIFFPAGVDLGVSAYSIHHNDTYFDRPFEFLPERWLKIQCDSESYNLARSAFCPFGIGRTSCVGQYLASQEISIVLARMIWLYEMRLQPGSVLGEGHSKLGPGRARKEEFQLYDVFTSTHEGPLVQFRLRGLK